MSEKNFEVKNGLTTPNTVFKYADGNTSNLRQITVSPSSSTANYSLQLPPTSGALVPAVLGAVTIDSGAILDIAVTSGGSGYTAAPTVVITGDGTFCIATAILTNGSVSSISVQNPGQGYTTATATLSNSGPRYLTLNNNDGNLSWQQITTIDLQSVNSAVLYGNAGVIEGDLSFTYDPGTFIARLGCTAPGGQSTIFGYNNVTHRVDDATFVRIAGDTGITFGAPEQYDGSSPHTVSIQAPQPTTGAWANYTLTLPRNVPNTDLQLLTGNTDGTLSWTTVVPSQIINGNSNVTVEANSVVTFGINGTANVAIINTNVSTFTSKLLVTNTQATTNLTTGAVTIGDASLAPNAGLAVYGNAYVGGLVNSNSILSSLANFTTAYVNNNRVINQLQLGYENTDNSYPVFKFLPETVGTNSWSTNANSWSAIMPSKEGVNGQMLTTDGNTTAKLSWAYPASLSNGNSNVRVNTNGNINISAVGNANVIQIDGQTLTMTGAITATGNLNSSQLTTGNITSNGTITLSGNINATGPNVSLGQVANLSIKGGSNGQVLRTDGNGTLNWTTISPNSVFSGNSNVVVAANANVTISSNGQANIITVTSNGTTATTYVSDNLVVGNAIQSGNLTYVNVNQLQVTDPIIDIGVNGNGGPLPVPDGRDRGIAAHLYGANLVTTTSANTANGNSILTLTSTTGATVGQSVYANLANGTSVFASNATVSNVDSANSQITVSSAATVAVPTGIQVIVGSDTIEFFGWKSAGVGAGQFVFAKNATIATGVVTITEFANAVGSWWVGNVSAQQIGANASSTTNVVGQLNLYGNTTTLAANSNLVITGNVFSNSANVTLGDVANLHILGGSNGQYLSTDGSGTLSWVTPTSVSAIHFNVTSNGNNQQFSNGNIYLFNNTASAMAVFRNGVLVKYTDYDVSGNNITLNIQLLNGDNIDIAPTIVYGNAGASGSGNITSNISNGISNVSISTSGGPVTFGVGGQSNVFIVDGVNATASGNVIATTGVQSPRLFNGNSNIAITANGNIDFTSNSATSLTVASDGAVYTGNLKLLTNTISSTATNGDVRLSPNGAGFVIITANTRVTGNILANANVTYNLGNSSLYWNSLYLSTLVLPNGNVTTNANGIYYAANFIMSNNTSLDFVSTGNISANIYSGNGSGLSQLAGANVTGVVANSANANIANVANYIATSGSISNNAVFYIPVISGNTSGNYALNPVNTFTLVPSTGLLTSPLASFTGTTDSSNTSTGAVISNGGLGVAKNIYGGGILNLGNIANSNTALNIENVSNTAQNFKVYANGFVATTGNANVANLQTAGVYGLANANSNVIFTSTAINFGANGAANSFQLGATAGGAATATLTASGGATLALTNTGSSITQTLTAGNGVSVTGGGNYPINVGNSNVIVRANSDVTISVGGTANVLLANSTAVTVANLNVSGNVTSNLLPNANVTYNLGSSTQRWKDIWLANSTIYLGNATISDSANGVTFGNANLVTSSVINGNSNIVIAANSNITFGVAGNASVLTITGTGINTAGTVNATGNISGQYFIGDGSLLTGLAPALQTYVFSNVASDISTYYQMQALSGWTAGTLRTITTSVTTSPTLLVSFATNTGLPNLTKIPIGSYQVNFETQRTSGAPNVTYYCYAEIYKRSSGGTETLLTTSDSTSTTTSQQVLQQITYKLNTSIVSLLSTDRIVVKVYAVASSTSNIDIRFDDNTNSLLNLPAPAADVATFVPYTGATSNLNLGSYAISTTGNANVGNLGTATAIITTGNITTINSGLIQNGNSNIQITANANVVLNSRGNSVVSITGTGANITGTANISGNVSSNSAIHSLFANVATGNTASFMATGTNTVGGTGFLDFLFANNSANATTGRKTFRIDNNGKFEMINSGYTASLFSVTDDGNVNVSGGYFVGGRPIFGPAFSAYPDTVAAAQTITSGSLQKVIFDIEEYDPSGNYANSRFTPSVAGYYQFNATVRLDNGGTGTGECMIVLYKNGSEYKRGWNSSGVQFASDWWSMSVSALAYSNGTTDYFEIYIQQGSGANRSVTRGSNLTWFNGCMVRGA